MSNPSVPRLGQRVRFTCPSHKFVPAGRCGMIDQISPEGQFIVLTDCGSWFGWTSFNDWEPTGEPDVDLSPEYIDMRTRALSDDSAINRTREKR